MKGIIDVDFVFGCVDNEGTRFILNEISLAYNLRYYDLSTEIIDESCFGGRLFTVSGKRGCLYCFDALDMDEVKIYLMTKDDRRNQEDLYGVPLSSLGIAGPSVISLNGTIASIAITEFIQEATGLRAPSICLTYRANLGVVSKKRENERNIQNCYYCDIVKGSKDKSDIFRYAKNNK